ncbi:MAG TPA: hypothetical protein DCW90_23120 [Lachnospiraceae bacterium]|nr:hypothetical protein [Lachnospiraceae bacterium]
MRGYKMTKPNGVFFRNPDLNGPLEVGAIYKEILRIQVQGPGYHFCQYIWDTMLYGNPGENEIWEIDTEDNEWKASRDHLSYVTTGFTVIRKLDPKEVRSRIILLDKDIILNRPKQLKKHAIRIGYWMDELRFDPDPDVRCWIAGEKKYSDFLGKDDNPRVREAVAKSGECLYYLIHDPDERVRKAAVEYCVKMYNVSEDIQV